MDFKALARRDLQFLCKKNRIPANKTNIAMANALQALDIVEGIEELKEKIGFKTVKSPEVLRSSDSRTAPLIEAKIQASPLPRSRRVTAKALEIAEICLDEKEEKTDVPETPATRRGKADAVLPTPVSRYNVRLLPDASESLKDLIAEGAKSFGTTTHRSKRLSLRKQVEEMTDVYPRSSSSRAKVDFKMAALAQEKAKEQEKDAKEEKTDAPETPATNRGRAEAVVPTPASRCSDRVLPRASESQKNVVAEGAKSFGTTTHRSTRFLRKQMEEMTGVYHRSSSRRAKEAVKMAALSQEEAKEQEKGAKTDVPETPTTKKGRAETVVPTPASRCNDRVLPGASETPKYVVAEGAKSFGTTSRRSSRLYLRKQVEETTDVYPSSHSSRAMAAVKMAALAQDEAQEQEKGIVEGGDLINCRETECLGSSSSLEEKTLNIVEVTGLMEEEDKSGFEESPVMGLVSSDANNLTQANETFVRDSSSFKNKKQTISAVSAKAHNTQISAATEEEVPTPEEIFVSVDGCCGVVEEEAKKVGQFFTGMTQEDGKVSQDLSFVSELPTSRLLEEEKKFTGPSSDKGIILRDAPFDTKSPNAPTDLATELADDVSVAVSQESETLQGSFFDVPPAGMDAGGSITCAIDLPCEATITGRDKFLDVFHDSSFQPKIAASPTEICVNLSVANNLHTIAAETPEVTEKIASDDSSDEAYGEGSHKWETESKNSTVSSHFENPTSELTTMSLDVSSIHHTDTPDSEIDSSDAVERENWLTDEQLKSLSMRQLKALMKQKLNEEKLKRMKSTMKPQVFERHRVASSTQTADANCLPKMEENMEPVIKAEEGEAWR